jgi:hypothetical protein
MDTTALSKAQTLTGTGVIEKVRFAPESQAAGHSRARRLRNLADENYKKRLIRLNRERTTLLSS